MGPIAKKEGYSHLIKWIIRLGDLLLINLFFILLYKTRATFVIDYASFSSDQLFQLFLVINLSYFITQNFINIDLSSNIVFFDKILNKSLLFITLYIVLLTVGISLLNHIEIRWWGWIMIYVSLSFIYISWHTLFRILLKKYRRSGRNFKRVIIIGKGLNGQKLYDEISAVEYGYRILGFFDDDYLTNSDAPDYLGAVSKFEQFCLTNDVDEVYCTLPGNQEAKIIHLLNFTEKQMIRFYLVPEFYKYIKRGLVLKVLHTIPIVGIRQEPLQQVSNRIIKRSFDIVFSSLVLITIFPVLYIVLGSLIKLTSSGPIFFKQKRTGLEGKPFECYKFRSMRINKEADIKTATSTDSRITKIGKFMRQTSLDEMPQFINVLKGEMSVVGPRPHMIQQTSLYSKFIDKFMVRHLVQPGITGWAQVSGFRGETKTIAQMEGRFQRDLWYLENWSFLLDIKIIFVTIFNILRGEDNAY